MPDDMLRPLTELNRAQREQTLAAVKAAQAAALGPALDDLRVLDSSSLTYVLINAVKELAARVEQLEHALAERRRENPGEVA